MKRIYFDAKGNPCSREEARNVTPEQRIIREFQNERFEICLSVADWVEIDNDCPPELAKPVEFELWNIVTTDSEGNPLEKAQHVYDRTERSPFETIEEGIKYYEEWLVANNAAVYQNGALKEIGNQLTPPDPDEPIVEENSAAGEMMGSW